jgi:hypothetical protein
LLRLRQPSTLRIVIWREANKAQNNIAAVSAPVEELRRQHGLGLDPPLEVFVQTFNSSGSISNRWATA